MTPRQLSALRRPLAEPYTEGGKVPDWSVKEHYFPAAAKRKEVLRSVVLVEDGDVPIWHVVIVVMGSRGTQPAPTVRHMVEKLAFAIANEVLAGAGFGPGLWEKGTTAFHLRRPLTESEQELVVKLAEAA